jgi:hypothetical protein
VSHRGREFWLSIAGLVYVCFAAAQSSPGARAPWVALVALPLLLSEAWRRTLKKPSGEDHVEPAARSALRACLWGAALWVAARVGPSGRPGFDAAANLAAGTTAVAALIALARVGSAPGLLIVPRAARSLDAAAFAALLWAVAAGLPATQALWPSRLVRLDPLAVDYATTTAGVGSLLILLASAWRLRVLRRLELGVGDRAAGALAVAIAALLLAVPAALLDAGPPDRVLPVTVMTASLLCVWTATISEPTRVSSTVRGLLAVMILGVPTTLLAAIVAEQAPGRAGIVVMATALLCIIVGVMARTAARPLGPEQSRWLDAIDAASRGALQPEPDAAIRAALESLGEATASHTTRPELWRLAPPQVLSVDVAGFLHVREGEAPAKLYELAASEPERTVRAEALGAVQVRRPDVRPLLDWFETRRAFSATTVVDEDGALGFILLPRGNRSAPMALEEARAVRLLADRISALLAVSSALARSRQREIDATRQAGALEEERQRLEELVLQQAGRHQFLADRAAQRVRAGAYSPAARSAVEELERLGKTESTVTMLVPTGVDATGWAAIAHLSSMRSGGPMVVADGTNGAEHESALWEDPVRSPLKLCDGGTLVLLNAPGFPLAVQELIVRAFARSSGALVHSRIPSAGLMVTVRRSSDDAHSSELLAQSLARLLESGKRVVVPALADRAEDLRALTLNILARLGLENRGEPLGVAFDAIRLIVEHDWPGNDVELEAVLTRAAVVASGAVVTAADLRAVGFSPVSDGAEGTPAPPPQELRRRSQGHRGGRRR